MKTKRSGSSPIALMDKGAICRCGARQAVRTTESRQIKMGMAKAIAYHPTPTRQRMNRAKNSRNPDRPEVMAVTMMAATNGPRGLGPLVLPRVNAKIHGYQDRANARIKNVTNLFCFKNAFILSSI